MKKDINIKRTLIQNNTYIILLVLVIICSVASENFFTKGNLINLCQQYAGTTVMTMGMLLVILTGGIDLTVGSYEALASVLSAYLMVQFNLNMFSSIAVALIVGTVCGAVTGLMVSKAGMAPFIATLASQTIFRGVAYMVSQGAPITTPSGTFDVMGTAKVFPFLTVLTLIALVVVGICFFILIKTSYGRIVVAIGSNADAVNLAGINVKTHLTSVYIISGFLSSLAGIIATSRTGSGSPLVGSGHEMDCIAACVIGGASLSGGEGSALKTLAGVLILALIKNIMNLMSVPSYPQDIIKGIIIILAVVLQISTSKIKTK